FQSACGDIERTFGQIFDDQFPRRVRLQSSVADHADVNLPTLDVLFSECVAIRRSMDELHPLLQLFVVVNHRRLRNAYRALFNHGLHEQRESQAVWAYHLLSLGKHTKAWNSYTVERQNLFRKRLVVRKRETARITAGVRLLQQFQIADNMLVEKRMSVEFFEKIKGNVRLVFFASLADDGEIALEADRIHLVAHGPQCRDEL